MKEEIEQAKELVADYKDFIKTKTAGFIPWQWTRQARLWNNKTEAEQWDDELGLFTQDDGSLKLAANNYYKLVNNIDN